MHTSRYAGYHINANRDYIMDGEESHRAPSDRTVSEYIVANEHTTMVTISYTYDKDIFFLRIIKHIILGIVYTSYIFLIYFYNRYFSFLKLFFSQVKPPRKNHADKYDREEDRRSRSAHNTRDSVLSGSSKHSLHPLRKSISHGSICDNGSDIYVTSAAYRDTSDIRSHKFVNVTLNYPANIFVV